MILARPATLANRARNRLREPQRAALWSASRESCRQLLERHIEPGARVAVAGAGNGDDVPLAWLARRCSELTLLDLDARSIRLARRRVPLPERRRVRCVRCDLTAGEADRITGQAGAGSPAQAPSLTAGPLAGGGYHAVIGDLFLTQLLYPALADAGASAARVAQVLTRHGPPITDAVLGRLHASLLPGGVAIYLHDAAGWWEGHPQPHTVEEILQPDTHEDRLALMARCRGPLGTDLRASLRRVGARVIDETLWEWPFSGDTRYLVDAVVARVDP